MASLGTSAVGSAKSVSYEIESLCIAFRLSGFKTRVIIYGKIKVLQHQKRSEGGFTAGQREQKFANTVIQGFNRQQFHRLLIELIVNTDLHFALCYGSAWNDLERSGIVLQNAVKRYKISSDIL